VNQYHFFSKSSKKFEEKDVLPNFLYDHHYLIPNSDEDTIRKEVYRPISLMKIVSQIQTAH
jgi:hypothetical protein